ncbi:50S ribosomal protein L3 [Phycisphaerales bacterium AB-hyl4]|uniref:Large ribosomal subunit protein uL3 n=1 Tax=Natronomicrosphaera hydrolytica TaxID=3242702 RepID=A0ABV4U9S7_9BACT
MATGILGRKIGMTRLYDEQGRNVPVTVIQAGPCQISQVKSADSDGYEAIQIAFDDMKARNSTFPLIGHDAKAGIAPKRYHREVRVGDGESANYELGQELTVEVFADVKFVDVTGTSKGKGFQGTMKRHNFKGQLASHGVERKHRSPGSIGGHANNAGKSGKIKKGKRMSGHMGQERVTVRSLPVVGIDKERNLLLVKGAVPGPKQGLLMVRESVRLYKRKAKLAKAS